MSRKVITVWLGLVMIISLIIILDVTIDFPHTVRGTTHYVNETGIGAYDKIQDAINASSNGDTIYVYSGTYHEKILINKSINITGENRNTTIIKGNEDKDVVVITADFVNISGFNITGSGYFSYDAGLKVRSDNNTIKNNNFYSNRRYGIRAESSEGNIIQNNCFLSNEGCGVSMYYSNYTQIIDNIAFNNSAVTISDSYNNTIANNIIEVVKNDAISLYHSKHNTVTLNSATDSKRGIYLYDSHENDIINNHINLSSQACFYLYQSNENKIHNNNVSPNSGRCFYMRESHENNIRNNNLSSSNTNGIYAIECCGNSIIENVIIANADEGMLLQRSRGNAISGNIIINNFTGICLQDSTGNTLEGNNASFNRGYGIELDFSDGNNVTGNTVINNTDGIMLSGADRNNIISNNISLSWIHDGMVVTGSTENYLAANNIFLNDEWGIYLDKSQDNVIVGNNFSKNVQGIFTFGADRNLIIRNTFFLNSGGGISLQDNMRQSIDNIIYHNNFFNNEGQASDSSFNRNSWNSSYPFGGNYWCNYEGNDSFKGPNQDVPGKDRIGDTPFFFDINSCDYYPLMEPYPNSYLFLENGWNLVSIPLIQSDNSIDSVLQEIQGEYDAVQYYNSSDNEDHWKHYHLSKTSQLNDLDEINHQRGIWVHIINPWGIVFLYNGTFPTKNQIIPLYQGWNLVGYPSLKFRMRDEALNNIDYDVDIDSVWTYDAATQTWKELGSWDYLEPGRGYWVHAKNECTWEIPL